MTIQQLWEYRRPFRHFRGTNVLPPGRYEVTASKFREILALPSNFRRSRFKNYDAQIMPIENDLPASFPDLFSATAISFLHRVVGIPFQPRVVAAIHSSPPNSRSGWIHTDYLPVWFDDNAVSPGEVAFMTEMMCDYTGRPTPHFAPRREYARAATMIYYLCNDDWSPADGGQTGLYPAERGELEQSSILIAPINNSCLIFECSPHSYHRFMTNPGRRRNSFILWLHLSAEDADRRWGKPRGKFAS
jgi:hypothetical protein